MFNFLASNTALTSWFGSITKIASGNFVISLIPPKNFSKRSRSRFRVKTSFLGNFSKVPSSSNLYSCFKRLIRNLIVLKLVSVPPNQR